MHYVSILLEIIMMSIALGLDAFSLCLGIGLHGINRQKAVFLCSNIGLFHILMTVIGLYAGNIIHKFVHTFGQRFGAILLLAMGIHIIYSVLFNRKQDQTPLSGVFGIVLFSVSVSIDAMSIGLSLGLQSTAYSSLAALAFGITAAIMSAIGLTIGKHSKAYIGVYGELLGAVILIGYGMRLFFY